ncbi:MAG: hypothetical protein ACK5Y6_01845, partial [Pseudomonadota bacterium]
MQEGISGHNAGRGGKARSGGKGGSKGVRQEQQAGDQLALDRVEALRNLLQELGLTQQGLGQLKPDSVVKLATLLQTKGQRSNLSASMFNAVADTTPQLVNKFVEIIGAYSGSYTILETFLTQLGERNPFTAARKAQILVLPSNDTGTARGASGHVLTGITYCAYDRETPTNTTGYISGKQAITKIFEAFSSDRVTSEAKHRVRSRRSSELRKALREFDLESLSLNDLEQHPKLKGDLRSQLITRNLAVYNELRKAIEDCKSHLGNMLYSGELTLAGINSLKVGQDPGRQFFGWFEDHFKENPNAPQGIKIAYASVCDEDIALTEAEEGHYLRGLLAYQRLHSYINKGTALGGLVSDLNQYEQLEISDSLRMDSTIERARQTLQATINSSSQELTIAEFSTILENAAMTRFRQEMNSRVLNLYRDEFEKALKLFEFVSFEKGEWRQDALGDSVPMERLKRHLYGARVGVASRWDSPEKKRAMLGQVDFRHIMDAQFLTRLISTEDMLLNAKPIAEFKAMVEGVVVAYRKAVYLEARLAEYGSTPDGAAATATIDREQIGEALSGWKPVLPVKTGFKPAEAWFETKNDLNPTERSIADIAARMRDRGGDLLARGLDNRDPLIGKCYDFTNEIELFAEAGLYRPDMEELWRELDAKFGSLVPAVEHTAILDRATNVLVHPMVIKSQYLDTRYLTKRFLLPKELAEIEEIAAVKEQLEGVCAGYNQAQLGELRAGAERYLNAEVLSGGIIRGANGRARLKLSISSFKEFAGVEQLSKDDRRLHFFKPTQLKEAIDLIETSYLEVKPLGQAWIDRARLLCSNNGKAAL